MKKIIAVIFVLVLVATGFFYFKPKDQTKENTQSMTNLSVRLKWLDQSQFAGYYYAKEQGFYESAGLNVDLLPGGPDVSLIQAVTSGSSDFGIIGADQIILAREKGVPVVAAAVIYKKTPVALASLKKSNIKTFADLKGKTVAIVYGKDEEMIYKALLDKESISRDQIKEVPLVFDLSQITTGKVDAQIVYEMNEPVLLVQKGFDIDLIKPRDYGINFYADTLFTTEKMVKEHPETVKKFVNATVKGWEEALKNQPLAVDYVMKRNGTLDREHQTKFLELSAPLVLADGKIGISDPAEWENMQNNLIKYGAMSNRIDVFRAFTNQFISN